MTYSRVEWLHTTIGAERFHFRVRDGIGWFPFAMAARQTFKVISTYLSADNLIRKTAKTPGCYLDFHIQIAWVLYGQASRSISTG
jgi:hypothetical protein